MVKDGKIAGLKPQKSMDIPKDMPNVNADGAMLFASFTDAHTHLREPGYEYKEDIESGLNAALHGGFYGRGQSNGSRTA